MKIFFYAFLDKNKACKLERTITLELYTLLQLQLKVNYTYVKFVILYKNDIYDYLLMP